MERAESKEKEKLTILLSLIVYVLFLFIPICVNISIQAYETDTSGFLILAAVVPLLTVFMCRIQQNYRRTSEFDVRRFFTWKPLTGAGMITPKGVEIF